MATAAVPTQAPIKFVQLGDEDADLPDLNLDDVAIHPPPHENSLVMEDLSASNNMLFRQVVAMRRRLQQWQYATTVLAGVALLFLLLWFARA